MSYIQRYLDEVKQICDLLDQKELNNFISYLQQLPSSGRCFIIGLGGSAANCTHMVNDLRKICNIDAMSPLDNVSELTARINDDGFTTCITNSLKVSKFSSDDYLIVLSVGGGSIDTSQPLVDAMYYAKEQGSKILSIVSRDGGVAARLSNVCVKIPNVCMERITPHAEEFQGIVWHMIVSYLKEVNNADKYK